MIELCNEDQVAFKICMRTPPPPSEMFDKLLTRVGSKITKYNITYRDVLYPGLKLALALQHLASGTKNHSMSYGWRVPHNNISLFIPEAIIRDYKDEMSNVMHLMSNTSSSVHQTVGPSNTIIKGFYSVVLLTLVDADYKFI